MEHLYAPWRSNYIRKPSTGERLDCPLCLSESPATDAEKFILKRAEHSYVMLNLYPYNPGHLMIAPREHSPSLHELTPQTRNEIFELAAQCEIILKRELGADGINMGLNIGGKAAGGTIPEHLHLHVLPRFMGDTNFLPLLSNTKQISLDLVDLYHHLIKSFQ